MNYEVMNQFVTVFIIFCFISSVCTFILKCSIAFEGKNNSNKDKHANQMHEQVMNQQFMDEAQRQQMQQFMDEMNRFSEENMRFEQEFLQQQMDVQNHQNNNFGWPESNGFFDAGNSFGNMF